MGIYAQRGAGASRTSAHNQGKCSVTNLSFQRELGIYAALKGVILKAGRH